MVPRRGLVLEEASLTQNPRAGLYMVALFRQAPEPPFAAMLGNLSWRLVAQGIHKLPDFVPLALCFLRSFLGDAIVDLEFRFRFGGVSVLSVGLSQSVMCLFHLRVRLNGLLVVGNGPRIISLLGVENAQLKVGSSKFRIETNRVLQERLNLRRAGRVLSCFPQLPQTDRVIVIRLGIVALLRDETVKPFDAFLRGRGLSRLHFSEEQVRSRIAGIQVGRLADSLHRLIVGTASEPGRAESDQHSN